MINSLNDGCEKYGGQEGRAIKFAIASLDRNNDGELSSEELERLDDRIDKIVEKALSMLLNAGVVSALILSMVFNWTFSDLSHAQESIDFFGEKCCYVFHVFFIVFVNLAVFGSFVLIYVTVRMYTHLAFWLASSEFKIKYLEKVPINFVGITTIFVIVSAILTIPFGAAVSVSPLAGLISFVLAVICVVCIGRCDLSYGETAKTFATEESDTLNYGSNTPSTAKSPMQKTAGGNS